MDSKKRKRMTFPYWPIYDNEEIVAITKVIKSGNWWCGSPNSHEGKNVWKFQEEFAKLQGAKYCLAVFNGTVAIEVALLALGIGLGDEVIVSDFTFVASASSIVATNAIPILCDIDRETFVMDVNKVEKLITERTKAIVAVHLGGNPVEMDALMKIANKYNLKVVEDCAHAHGSKYKGRYLGTWGHAGTFSFQASKVLTSGEGGAIITNDEQLADLMYSISDCGRIKKGNFYTHNTYGSNFRMTEYQAALLLKQMERFPAQHKLRNDNAFYFMERLNRIDGIKAIKPTPGTTELGWYVFPVIFDPDKFNGITPNEFYSKLIKNHIPFNVCYPPLHSLKCFKTINLRKNIDYSNANWGGSKSEDKNFPNVTDIYSHCIEFPHQMFLASKEHLDSVIEFISSLKK